MRTRRQAPEHVERHRRVRRPSWCTTGDYNHELMNLEECVSIPHLRRALSDQESSACAVITVLYVSKIPLAYDIKRADYVG